MIISPVLAALAAMAQPAPASAPVALAADSSTRWDWRVCTRNSADVQLRARPRSLEYQSVVRRAFEECEALLVAVARTQSADEIERLRQQQSELIRADVEIFYWDHMTGHI